jgi:hypothetical protein
MTPRVTVTPNGLVVRARGRLWRRNPDGSWVYHFNGNWIETNGIFVPRLVLRAINAWHEATQL